MKRLCIVLFILTTVLCGFISATVVSYAVTFSGEVPFTTLTFSGYTSPKAFVEITSSGTTIGTTVADSQGNFSYEISDLGSGGQEEYEIFSQDITNNDSNISDESIDAVDHQDNAISNIYLSPTIAFTTTSQTLSGYAYASSKVTIDKDGTSFTQLTSNSAGLWQYTFPKTSTSSTHVFTATWQDSSGNVSQVSPSLSVTVPATTTQVVITPTSVFPRITTIITNTPSPTLSEIITTTATPTATPQILPAAQKQPNSLLETILHILGTIAIPTELLFLGLGIFLFIPDMPVFAPETPMHSPTLGIIRNCVLIFGFAGSIIYAVKHQTVLAIIILLLFPLIFLIGTLLKRRN